MFKFNVSAKEESNFQKKHILKLKDEYLNTNTINKYKEDKCYDDIPVIIKDEVIEI